MKRLPTLETARLVLRPFCLTDAKRIRGLGAKEVAATTLNIPHPYEESSAENWIQGHQQLFQEDKSLELAVCLKSSRELIGAVGLRIDREHERGSLGYWIGAQYWNKGYCTEAAKAIVRHGFYELDLHRIFAAHLSGNPASGKVMQKLGMQKEGVLREHAQKWGEPRHLVYYGMLRSEFIKREQPAVIQIDDTLRLRAYDGNFEQAIPWYQDQTVYYNSEGITDPAKMPDEDYVRRMFAYLHNRGELYFIEVVENDEYIPIGDVTMKAVHPPIVIGVAAYRGRGIGKKVMGAILQRAKEVGITKIRASAIYDYNIASQKLHETLGFHCVEIRDNLKIYELEL